MAWSVPTTRSSGYTVTATNWNELVNDFAFLAEVNYTAYTSDVSVTATTVGAANQVVSAGAITLQAVPHMIDFYCPHYTTPAQTTNIIVRDGTTVLGSICLITASATPGELKLSYRVTPTAASHTYNIAAWLGGAATGTMKAGTGGTTGDGTTYVAGYIRLTRVPT